MKKYAGIGSRQTPIDIQTIMTNLAIALANENWILRSDGAEGADSAFELGARLKEIYLPWNGFCGKYADNNSYFVIDCTEDALDFVYNYHPRGEFLQKGALKLMTRNTYQVLGPYLDDPVDVLFCWTSDGKASGGTGQAMRIAKDYNIPIVNLYYSTSLDQWLNKNNIKLA